MKPALITCLALLLVTCAERSRPARNYPEGPTVWVAPEPGPGSQSGPTHATAESTVATATPPPPPTQSTPIKEVRPGVGSCSADTDCVAAHSIDPAGRGNDACCVRFCPPPGAVSRAVVAAETAWKQQNCQSVKCSVAPPAPCRFTPEHVVPRCHAGRCVAEIHERPPPQSTGY